MSEEKRNNATEDTDDIGKILAQYKAAKENAKKREDFVEPPKHSVTQSPKKPADEKIVTKSSSAKPSIKTKKQSTSDFAPQTIESIRQNTIDARSKKGSKGLTNPHQKKHSLESEIKKTERKKEMRNSGKKVKLFFKSKYGKILICLLIAIVVIAVAIWGIMFAVDKSNNAYLTPYEEKYGITMPDGMLEEYCDEYANTPSMIGSLTIDSNSYPITTNSDKGIYLDQKCTTLEVPKNAVIYASSATLPNLESSYSTADAYNSAEHYIQYGTLFEKSSYRIVGAFYTSTVADDDNGYIFPYNVTGKMTSSSFKDYSDSLMARFIYSTGYTITKGDTLLTLSVDTSFHQNFRFVVVAVMTSDDSKDITATVNQNPQYPQVIYDENGQYNPYLLAKKWYPEIVTSSGKKIQQTIEDYQ